MHSFTSPNGTVFIHNPDLSGYVEIVQKDGTRTLVDGPDLAAFIEAVVVRWIEAKRGEASGE